MSCLQFFAALVLIFTTCKASRDNIEEEGYYKREHSLVQPYHGNGMDIPFWRFGGSTVITSNYVRLTPDHQSMKGILWNTYPVRMHNWEMVVEFSVHGQGKNLFGDGFAVWYTKEYGEMGNVFGSRDFFTGLAVFFDTYSNQNGEHSHDHPYISAMVNNGSLHYDHDRDGTHSQVSGCTCYFRNSRHDTFVAISYINRQVTVMTNIDGGESEWKMCFSANDVDLPTGYYFGVTATTGELADNHDVISLKVYDVDGPPVIPLPDNGAATEPQDWSTVMPHAGVAEAPRAHVDDVKPALSSKTYRVLSYGLIILLVVAVVVVVGGIAFVKNQEKSRKRYF